MAQGNGDTFTRWIVGIAGSATIALCGIVLSMREDVALLKSEMLRYSKDSEHLQTIGRTVDNHEWRIETLERDDTRVTPQWRQWRRDTIRSGR